MYKGTQTNPAQLPSVPSSGTYNSSPLTLNNGDQVALQVNSEGYLLTTLAGSITVTLSPATGTGFHISSNAVQSIKSSAGTLFGYFLDNTANSATTYFQFFNVASGSVSLGVTASAFVIPVPAGLAANLWLAGGSSFSTAMSFATTTTYNGSTAPSSAVDCTIWWS